MKLNEKLIKDCVNISNELRQVFGKGLEDVYKNTKMDHDIFVVFISECLSNYIALILHGIDELTEPLGEITEKFANDSFNNALKKYNLLHKAARAKCSNNIVH